MVRAAPGQDESGTGGCAYPAAVPTIRICSRQTCREPAIATLTYVYADSMAVLGPLSASPEPHSYDLCAHHAERLSAPQGWTVLHISAPAEETPLYNG
jgi:Protein of unknown function (DUF3499)